MIRDNEQSFSKHKPKREKKTRVKNIERRKYYNENIE
jgi:hypothetical protein